MAVTIGNLEDSDNTTVTSYSLNAWVLDSLKQLRERVSPIPNVYAKLTAAEAAVSVSWNDLRLVAAVSPRRRFAATSFFESIEVVRARLDVLDLSGRFEDSLNFCLAAQLPVEFLKRCFKGQLWDRLKEFIDQLVGPNADSAQLERLGLTHSVSIHLTNLLDALDTIAEDDDNIADIRWRCIVDAAIVSQGGSMIVSPDVVRRAMTQLDARITQHFSTTEIDDDWRAGLKIAEAHQPKTHFTSLVKGIEADDEIFARLILDLLLASVSESTFPTVSKVMSKSTAFGLGFCLPALFCHRSFNGSHVTPQTTVFPEIWAVAKELLSTSPILPEAECQELLTELLGVRLGDNDEAVTEIVLKAVAEFPKQRFINNLISFWLTTLADKSDIGIPDNAINDLVRHVFRQGTENKMTLVAYAMKDRLPSKAVSAVIKQVASIDGIDDDLFTELLETLSSPERRQSPRFEPALWLDVAEQLKTKHPKLMSYIAMQTLAEVDSPKAEGRVSKGSRGGYHQQTQHIWKPPPNCHGRSDPVVSPPFAINNFHLRFRMMSGVVVMEFCNTGGSSGCQIISNATLEQGTSSSYSNQGKSTELFSPPEDKSAWYVNHDFKLRLRNSGSNEVSFNWGGHCSSHTTSQQRIFFNRTAALLMPVFHQRPEVASMLTGYVVHLKTAQRDQLVSFLDEQSPIDSVTIRLNLLRDATSTDKALDLFETTLFAVLKMDNKQVAEKGVRDLLKTIGARLELDCQFLQLPHVSHYSSYNRLEFHVGSFIDVYKVHETKETEEFTKRIANLTYCQILERVLDRATKLTGFEMIVKQFSDDISKKRKVLLDQECRKILKDYRSKITGLSERHGHMSNGCGRGHTK